MEGDPALPDARLTRAGGTAISDLDHRLSEVAEHKRQMAAVDEAARRERTGEAADRPRWLDSLGREVDLDNIDREYALNILTMVVFRRGRRGYEMEDLRHDALVQKLRDVVLNGREPNAEDRRRAMQYNIDNVGAGLPYRAPVR